MNEHPFDQSTHIGTGSSLAASGEAIELRYAPALRNIIAGACAMGGVIAFAVLSRVADPSGILGIMRFVVLLIDIVTAAFVWWFLGSYLVRADAAGVTYSNAFKRAFVPWEKIAAFEMRQVGNSNPSVSLLDAQGKKLLTFNCAGSAQERERFLDFLDDKMTEKGS